MTISKDQLSQRSLFVCVCVCVCVRGHMFMLVTYLSQANVISTYHKLERITQKRYSAANYGMPHTARGEQIVCVCMYVHCMCVACLCAWVCVARQLK